MKKLLILALVPAFFMYGCKDDSGDGVTPEQGVTVSQESNAIFLDITATWCPPCGEYGGPAFEAAIVHKPELSSAIAVHTSSSDLGTQIGDEIAGAYQATGIPTLAVGNQKTGAYTDIQYTTDVLIGFADSYWNATAKAGVALEKSVDGNTVTIKTHTKFFEAGVDGASYQMSVFLTEDGVFNKQAHTVQGEKEIEHNHVLKSAATATFGDVITSDAIAADALIENDYTLSTAGLHSSSKLDAVAILWELDGTTLTFVNCKTIEIQ